MFVTLSTSHSLDVKLHFEREAIRTSYKTWHKQEANNSEGFVKTKRSDSVFRGSEPQSGTRTLSFTNEKDRFLCNGLFDFTASP